MAELSISHNELVAVWVEENKSVLSKEALKRVSKRLPKQGAAKETSSNERVNKRKSRKYVILLSFRYNAGVIWAPRSWGRTLSVFELLFGQITGKVMIIVEINFSAILYMPDLPHCPGRD